MHRVWEMMKKRDEHKVAADERNIFLREKIIQHQHLVDYRICRLLFICILQHLLICCILLHPLESVHLLIASSFVATSCCIFHLLHLPVASFIFCILLLHPFLLLPLVAFFICCILMLHLSSFASFCCIFHLLHPFVASSSVATSYKRSKSDETSLKMKLWRMS